jgi:hypothetical protein
MPAETPSESLSEPPSSRLQPFQAAWPAILCVVGLDYMSTLGYVPSIAFDTTGRLAPLVMTVVVLVTVLGALPIYFYLCRRSPHGKGSLVLLERLIPGWRGKLLVLVLLGFAATDLIFTRTFSVADAAEHLIHGPHPAWQKTLDSWGQFCERQRQNSPPWVHNWTAGWSNRQLVVTVLLLLAGIVVSIIFRKGFRKRFVQLAVVTVVLYLVLNALIIAGGLYYLSQRPELIDHWWNAVLAGDWQARSVSVTGPVQTSTLIANALALFPKAAIGLSGFEMAMLLMPLVRGRNDDDPVEPKGRIRNTRKMLIWSALLMSIYLLGSSFVTTILIPYEAFHTEGQAANRALAYLAHGGALAGVPGGEKLLPFFGMEFGTLYDISTIVILSLAGVSVGVTLSEFVPPYLHRLGMELNWVHNLGALIYVFAALKLGVTIYYKASVDDQRGAYTSSVLMIFAAGAFTAGLDVWQRRVDKGYLWRFPIWFGPMTLVFLGSALMTMWDQPGGAVIAMWFVILVHFTSIITRMYRSTELRFNGFEFVDEASRLDFEKLKTLDFPLLVPHRPGRQTLCEKEIEIRQRHRLPDDKPLVFLIAELGDPSDFYLLPRVQVCREDGRVVIHVSRCASIAHVVAAIAIEMSHVGVAPEIHFGWSDENPITANLHFVLFGHGNVPWLVYSILKNSTLPLSQRPRVVVG